MIEHFCYLDWANKYKNVPLAIVGSGPSLDCCRPELYLSAPCVFALNATITETYRHKDCWWVVNDMDQFLKKKKIYVGTFSRMVNYDRWQLVTPRKFLPGKDGDVEWINAKNNRRTGPVDKRISHKQNATVAWFEQLNKRHGFIQVGHSVVKTALDVANCWGFSPIVMFGIDLALYEKNGKKVETYNSNITKKPKMYYARPFSWKSIPLNIYRGKMNLARLDLKECRESWHDEIYLHEKTGYDKAPFRIMKESEIREVFRGETVRY